MQEGLVTKSTGSWYRVETAQGTLIDCRLKGKFRSKGIKSTNPVAVGDHVQIEAKDDNNSYVIENILPRKNYIIRKATKLSKQSHIIAANIDQAILVVTISHPRTSTGFIDRFLTTAEAYHIPSILIFNKLDLYHAKSMQKLQEYVSIYTRASYQCIMVSAKTGENLMMVKNALKDKVSLLAGHSGVGKSMLINAIQPGLNLRVKAISQVHEKGLHTTTFAEMHKLDLGGYIVDTPGIKEFGLINFDKWDIAERFPEFRAVMHDCRFNNCLHINEPGCAVLDAVEKGEIHESRYINYLNIIEEYL